MSLLRNVEQETQIWKPLPRQEDLYSLPDSVFEALYGGAAGGGKSEGLLYLPLIRNFYIHPRFKGLILRRTYPELDAELVVRSWPFYKAAGGEYNEEKKRWTFPSRAIIQFGYCEYEKDKRRYDSSEYNYVAFDELTSFLESQYMYIAFTRCRTGCSELPAIVRSGTNPGNVGHGWVRDRFVEPAPPNTIVKDKVTGMKRIFIPSKVTDNSHLMKSDPDYVNRLMMLPEAERKAKLDGDWYTFSGQVFDDWRETRYPDEPENAIHVIDPFDIPSWWPRIFASDWGYSAMACNLWGALSPDDRLYIYREHCAKRAKISTWGTECGLLSTGEHFSDAVMDPSGWQNRGESKSIADQFIEFSGIQIHQAVNDRVGGKNLVQEYLRFRPRPPAPIRALDQFDSEFAAGLLRTSGLQTYSDYLDSFKQKEIETNLPRLQVFSNCVELRKAIPLCVYDENNKEDVAEFPGDDPYDCLRYLIQAADSHLRAPKSEDALRKKVAEAEKVLSATGNQTAFYRRMEKLDREARAITPAPVRRYHARMVS